MLKFLIAERKEVKGFLRTGTDLQHRINMSLRVQEITWQAQQPSNNVVQTRCAETQASFCWRDVQCQPWGFLTVRGIGNVACIAPRPGQRAGADNCSDAHYTQETVSSLCLLIRMVKQFPGTPGSSAVPVLGECCECVGPNMVKHRNNDDLGTAGTGNQCSQWDNCHVCLNVRHSQYLEMNQPVKPPLSPQEWCMLLLGNCTGHRLSSGLPQHVESWTQSASSP